MTKRILIVEDTKGNRRIRPTMVSGGEFQCR